MTDDEIRVKIAEAIGITWCEHKELSEEHCCASCGWNPSFFPHVNAITFKPISDYLNDLNAIHEAVMTKRRESDEWYSLYKRLLEDIVIKHNESSAPADTIYSTEATALQRAEAFVATLNL